MPDPAYQEYPFPISTDHFRATGAKAAADPHPVPNFTCDRWHSAPVVGDSVLSGDLLGIFSWRGYDGTALTEAMRIDCTAIENWDATHHGVQSTWQIAGSPILTLTAGGITANVPLTLSADPSGNLGAATKQYVDSKASTGGPPSGPATGDLTGTYPGPTLVTAQKNLWQAPGASVTPLDATKTLAIPANVAATIGNPLILGARTVKARASVFTAAATATQEGLFLSLNRDPSTGAQDDTGKSSWQLGLRSDSDNVVLQRFAPGGAGGDTLSFDALGRLLLSGDATNGANIVLGPVAIKARVQQSGSGAAAVFTINRDWSGGNTWDDNTRPQWGIQLNQSSDQFWIQRAPANTTTQANIVIVDNAGNMAIAGKLNAPALIGARNSAAQTGGSWSTYNTNLDIISQTITTKGGLVIITVNMNLQYIQLGSTGNALVDQFLLRDGAAIAEVPRNVGGAVVTPLPAFTWVDNPGAGLHTYKLQIWIGSGTSAVVNGTTGNPGTIMMQEIGA